MIIDTHAHLNIEAFDNDLDDVIKEANIKNVEKIIVIGMDFKHNLKAIEIANNHRGIFAAVGVHPCDVNHADVSDVIPLLKERKVVAVGEIGIDLYWDKTNLELQKKVFTEQIEIAIKHNLPVIIHTRESFKEAYDCVLPYKGKIRGVFHCLTSNLEDARKVVDLDMYVGIGGVVTFKNATNVQEIARHISLDKILVETDAPYLAPHPYRGKRNEPAYTKLVVEKIALLRGITAKVVEDQTTLNAMTLFNLED